MAENRTMNAKVLQVVYTTAQWAETETASKVISKGQIVGEYTTDNKTRLKVGDGVNVFANLPYVDPDIASMLDTTLTSTTLPAQGKAAGDAIANAYNQANSAFNQANDAFNAANDAADVAANAYTQANSAFNQANDAFNAANTVAETLNNAFSVDTYSLTLNGAVTGSNTFTLDELANGVNMETTLSGFDASKITSGTIDLARIPQAALERLVIVANEAALLALTVTDVQNGDVVKVEDSGLMYFVKDQDELGTMNAFEIFTAGTASAVEWANVLNKPAFDTNLNNAGEFADAKATGDAIKLAESNVKTIADNAYNQANDAFNQANTAYNQANDAFNQANDAFDAANNAATDVANVAEDVANLANEVITVQVDGAVTATAANAKLGETITLTTTVNNITSSDVGLGNVANARQVDALTTVNSGDVVTWGADGHTVVDSGINASTIVTDADTLILNCIL